MTDKLLRGYFKANMIIIPPLCLVGFIISVQGDMIWEGIVLLLIAVGHFFISKSLYNNIDKI